MTVESAREFVKKLKTSKEFSDSLQDADDESRRKIISDEGFDFTKDEFNHIRSEISDDELSAIIGGVEIPGVSGKKAGIPETREKDSQPAKRE